MATSTKPPVNVIFGGSLFSAHDKAFFGQGYDRPTTEELKPVFDKIKDLDVPFDTARFYPDGEAFLKSMDVAGRGIRIHTKSEIGYPGNLKPENLKRSIKTSLETLGVEKVEVFYFHAPDVSETYNMEETMDALNEIYQTGVFEKFGVCNFRPEDVLAIHAYCTRKSYVLPTVYSGPYSILTRVPESNLFPVLRRLNIAYNAYSPLMGGFLLMDPAELEDRSGRWGPDSLLGQQYRKTFYNQPHFDALAEFKRISEETATGRLELAVRWLMYHSLLSAEHGDGVIIGASRLSQLEETWEVYFNRGPLEEEVVKRLNGLWELVKDVAVLDAMNTDVTLSSPKL